MISVKVKVLLWFLLSIYIFLQELWVTSTDTSAEELSRGSGIFNSRRSRE